MRPLNTILLGNIVSFAGAIIMVLIGLIQSRKKILTVQCLQFGIMGLGNLILGGTSGAVSNLLGILRNLLCLRMMVLPGAVKALFIALQCLLTLLVNNHGLIGWLPAASTALLTVFLDVQDTAKLKWVLLITQLGWLVYDLTILNYASSGFDVFAIIMDLVGLYQLKKERKGRQDAGGEASSQ